MKNLVRVFYGCVTIITLLSLVSSSSAGYIGFLDIIPSEIFYYEGDILSHYSGEIHFSVNRDAALRYIEDNMDIPMRIYLDLGTALLDLKRYDDAEDAFSEAISVHKDNLDALLGLGMVKFYKGQYPFAISKFDDVLRKDARNVLAWTYKAVSQANSGNLNNAIESIEKATSYGSKEAIAWYYAAAIYAENGDMAKAVDAIKTAKSLEPDNQYILELESELSGSLVISPNQITGNDGFIPLPTADTKLYASEDINSEYWEGFWKTNFGVLEIEEIRNGNITGTYTHDSGKITGSIKGNIISGTWSEEPSYLPPKDAGDFEFALNTDGLSFNGKYRYGSSGTWDTWDGEKLKEEDTLQLGNSNSMEITPSSDDILEKGKQLFEKKEYAEAINVYDQILLIEPDNPEALENKGYALHYSGKHTDAVKIYELALESNPGSFKLWYNLALVNGALKNYGDAITAFKKALKIEPNNVEAMSNMAYYLREIGKEKEAIEMINKALQIKPEDAGLQAMKELIVNYDDFQALKKSIK